jgi:hypothetical protein
MKKYIYLIITAALFAINQNSKAQEVVLSEKVIQDSVRGKYGPNMSHYLHFYAGFGFITPVNQNTGSEIYFGKANNFEIGLRYKKRITNWLALGANLYYEMYNYRLEQNDDKTFPDTLIYGKQKVKSHNFGIAPYLRINIGRRGNRLGNYLDVGVFGNVIFSQKLKAFDTPDGKEKVVLKDAGLLNSTFWGVYANIGIANSFVLFAKYNMSELVKPGNANYADLPPLTIGLQFNFSH